MLFAAGCKLENGFDTVIPIIIDPDISNGDLDRTKNILRLYQEIRNQIDHPDDFYAQELKTINELANNSSIIHPEYFQFKLSGVEGSSFRNYIGFDELSENSAQSEDDKNFVRLLYSDTNLDSDLSVGFKGNPNMGSIVLNQFTNSEDFKKFGQTFGPGDAIFIINSIFGGTGAAGFPLLLKNLRGNDTLPHHAQIKEAPIGGITYLPYFSLSKQEEVKSESFEEKAKMAIDYYNRTIINQKKINALYFIGNKGNTNILNYAVGGKEQKNDSHFLEIAGALAILDFCKNISKHVVSNGIAVPGTEIKEFGIENETDNITFNDLNLSDAKTLSGPLTKFKFYTSYLSKGLPKALNISRWTKSNIKFVRSIKNSPLDTNYFKSAEYNIQIQAFNNLYDEWLAELARNKPSFSPFMDITNDNALKIVKGKVPNGDLSFKALDIQNCKLIDLHSIRPIKDKRHTMLVKLFSKSTTAVLKNRDLLIQ
jgi:hypothetical protein